MSNIEQTLSIIKPDAVERNLENEIKEIFKSKGFKIIEEKKIQLEKSEAESEPDEALLEPAEDEEIGVSGLQSQLAINNGDSAEND